MTLNEIIEAARASVVERSELFENEDTSSAWAEQIQGNDDHCAEIVGQLAALDITEIAEPHAHWCLKHNQPWDSSEPVCEEHLGISRYFYPPEEEIECELGALYAIRVKEGT